MSAERGLRLVLVAEESAGVQLLRAISRTPHQIVTVLTSEPEGPVRGATVWHVARKLELPTRAPRLVKSRAFASEMREQEIDLLLNVHSLYVIRRELLDAARIGGFNLHPGPLPRYAGLNSPSWALFHDEPAHGVTIHWMEPGIDTGAIAYQKQFPLTAADTALTVAGRCIREGVALLLELLETAAVDPGQIPRRAQDLSQRTYFGREVPQGGVIRWDQPARHVFNLVRAADYHPLPSPWGHPRTHCGELTIGLVKATPTGRCTDSSPGTVAHDRDGAVLVACADEWLRVTLVERDGLYGRPDAALAEGSIVGDARDSRYDPSRTVDEPT